MSFSLRVRAFDNETHTGVLKFPITEYSRLSFVQEESSRMSDGLRQGSVMHELINSARRRSCI
jgi:hypothetical protein